MTNKLEDVSALKGALKIPERLASHFKPLDPQDFNKTHTLQLPEQVAADMVGHYSVHNNGRPGNEIVINRRSQDNNMIIVATNNGFFAATFSDFRNEDTPDFEEELCDAGFSPYFMAEQIQSMQRPLSSFVDATLENDFDRPVPVRPIYAGKFGGNNGVMVVYDHTGRPHVRLYWDRSTGINDSTRLNELLTQAGYVDAGSNVPVPHSNGGQEWVKTHQPELAVESSRVIIGAQVRQITS